MIESKCRSWKALKNAREIIQEATFELMYIFTNEN